jgi:dihydroorotate dehydrogenase (fumarate)
MAKRHVEIPIIASLNACSLEGWVELARKTEKAGADALELNIYNMSLSMNTPSAKIEDGYVNVVSRVVSALKIPVSVKMSPFFTNLALMTSKLENAGAAGLVFFNRFYQPDLDLLAMGPGYSLRLSTATENRLPLRWISLLYRQVRVDLAAGTGVRTGSDVLKMILSGASAVQLCSVLLQRGIPWLEVIDRDLRRWMETCKVTSLQEARGILSRHCNDDPGEVERDEYRRALQGYSRIDVPDWRDEVPLKVDYSEKAHSPLQPLTAKA